MCDPGPGEIIPGLPVLRVLDYAQLIVAICGAGRTVPVEWVRECAAAAIVECGRPEAADGHDRWSLAERWLRGLGALVDDHKGWRYTGAIDWGDWPKHLAAIGLDIIEGTSK